MVSLEISPQDCLVDEQLQITIRGNKEEIIRVEATITDEKGYYWASWADFESKYGIVDLSTQAPLRGTYTGVQPMGLFYSLFPAPGERFPNRLMPRDVSLPQVTKIAVFSVPSNCEAKKGTKSISLGDGEIIILQSCCKNCTNFPQTRHKITPLAEMVIKRRYMAEGVEKREIEEDGVCGTLFIPSKKWGKKTFPAVIDLFGSVGGLVEHRSALFASKGVISLALPFFNYKTLPKTTKDFDMVYFEKAIKLLKSVPMVEKVGAIGVSQGGAFVLTMAEYLPKGLLSGVISISPPSRFFDTIYYKGEKILDPVKFSVGLAHFLDMGDSSALLADSMFNFQLDIDPLNLENSEMPILFLTGEDDKNLPATALAEHMISHAQKERKKNGKKQINNFRHLSFKDAGHLLEPPYSPHCYCSWHGTVGFVMIWGGDVDKHAAAQEVAWEETIKFIHENLTNNSVAKL